MERQVTVVHPVESTLFTPTQFQPRAVLQHSMAVGWSWFCQHMVSFRRFIRDHRTSMVVTSVDIRYQRPFGFFDADDFTVGLDRFRLRRGGLEFDFDVRLSADGAAFAEADIVCTLLRLSDDASLSALPARLSGELLAMVRPHEIDPSPAAKPLPGVLAGVEAGGTRLAECERGFTVYRHLCEVADQWSFVELPGYAGASRERLVMESDGSPALLPGLRQPLRRFVAEFRRPLYLFDSAVMRTRAYAVGGELAFVHRLLDGAGQECAVAVELF